MNLPDCMTGLEITGQPEAIRAVVDALLSNGFEVSWDDRFNREFAGGNRTFYAATHRGAACVVHAYAMTSSSHADTTPCGEDAPSASRDDAPAEGAPNFFP